MPYEPFHLGTKKHIFIDWNLIKPGCGLSFGGSEQIKARLNCRDKKRDRRAFESPGYRENHL